MCRASLNYNMHYYMYIRNIMLCVSNKFKYHCNKKKSVQLLFYYITNKMIFITISRFMSNKLCEIEVIYYVMCIYNIATWT